LLESSRAGDTSDEDSDSSDGSIESEDIEEEYLSLKQVVEALETFYGLKEDQGMLIFKVRSSLIKKNEKIKDFNLRYCKENDIFFILNTKTFYIFYIFILYLYIIIKIF